MQTIAVNFGVMNVMVFDLNGGGVLDLRAMQIGGASLRATLRDRHLPASPELAAPSEIQDLSASLR